MPAFKDTKRGTWYANFYYIAWTGKKEHKCKRGFKLERDAKQYEKDFRDRLIGKSDILFQNLVKEYQEDMKHRLRSSTMENKEYILRDKILPYFQDLKICDISTISIRKWQNLLIDHREPDGSPYKDTYLKTINNQMSAVMNYAVKHYGLPGNPCHSAGSIGKCNADEMHIWTEAEYKKAIFFEKKSGHRLAFDILFYSGIREGELLALTPADILPSKKIDINKTLSIVAGKSLIGPPKTPRSVRKVPIPDFLYTEIQEYMSKLYEIQPDEQIFTFTKSSLCREIKGLAEKSGLYALRVHDLRHSYASMLINMNIPIVEVSRLMGHKSIKTTADIYGHLYPDKVEDIASRLEENHAL